MFGLFTSCNNELNVAADWKEVAIVYGVLNPTDDTNYIRIQRAYLDESRGALNFIDIPDSLYFDSLLVSITEYLGSTELNTYYLQKVDGNSIGLAKDSGMFQSEVNYLYRLNAPIRASSYVNNYSYKLTVFNPKTGYLVTSKTVSVGAAEVESPVSSKTKGLIILADSNFKIVSLYQEGKYVRSYDMVMKIRVEEISLDDSTQRETKELKWVMFRNRKTNSLKGFEDGYFLLPSASFFNMIQSQLDSNLNVRRRLLDLDLYTYGAADELYTYINVNTPSIGIVQKKPEYTNIENGFGIFSSRYINKELNKEFDIRTRNALRESDITKNLNFVLY